MKTKYTIASFCIAIIFLIFNLNISHNEEATEFTLLDYENMISKSESVASCIIYGPGPGATSWQRVDWYVNGNYYWSCTSPGGYGCIVVCN